MKNYNLILSKFNSHSGEFAIMEEQTNNKTEIFYALKLSKNYVIDFLQEERQNQTLFCKLNQIRHYIKIDNNQKYYLFEYVEGSTIQEYILLKRSQKQSIDLDTINNYLTQLLEALFQLHKNGILGRIFSTENIINKNGNLILMDFGFGPELLQSNLDILAPPERIENLLNIEQNQKPQSQFKMDSWLLGAFLYHLIKLRPINSIRDDEQPTKMKFYKYSEISLYYKYIQEQKKISSNIQAESKIYTKNLTTFINGLLTYDVQNRLSFLDIYKSEYVRSLNLPKQQTYVDFYQDYENRNNEFEIGRDISDSCFFNTSKLDRQNNQIIQKEIENTDNKQPPETQDGDNSEEVYAQLPYINSCINVSKYKKIWKQINLQQFRYFILNDTAKQIQNQFSQDKYQLSYIVQYTLRKQSYFILIEIFNQLDSNEIAWKETNKDEWVNFKLECKFKMLHNEIKQAKQESIENLQKISLELEKVTNQNLFQTYLYGREDLKVVVDSILSEIKILTQFDKEQDQGEFNLFSKYHQQYFDQENKQIEMGNEKYQNILSTEFENQKDHWWKGYILIINDQYSFFQQFSNDPDYKNKYSGIILQVLFCRLVNLIFSYEQINSQFKYIQKKGDEETVDEGDIYKFLQSKDNDELKYQETEHLLNKYFQQKKQQ